MKGTRWFMSVFGVTLAGSLLALTSVHGLDLVKEGKPVATIVLPDQANENEQKAALVLVNYIKMAGGATLPIAKESDKIAGTIISLGRTRLAESAGLSAKDLKSDGYHLRVKKGTLYILGRDVPGIPNHKSWGLVASGAQGSWRAVLGLLEQIGFRWLEPTEKGVYVPPLKTVTVPDDLKLTCIPPFMDALSGISPGDWTMANNFRCSINLFTMGGHTWTIFVPASLWETHPEYFIMRGGKRVKPMGNGYFLCPSNPDVQKLLADGIRQKFDAGYDWVQLGQSDGYQPCECDVCKALDKPGECQEQVHIPHYNVIKMVQKTHPDKKVHLIIYGPTSKPSAKINKYPPNTVLEICSSKEETIRLWSAKAPAGSTVYVYYMGTYHAVGYAPKFTPRLMAEEIRKLHELGVIGIYFCGGGENWGAEGPTYYVAGRMMGNPDLDWSTLVDEYCNLTFGKAGKTMRRYYDLLYQRVEGEQGLSLSAARQRGGAEILTSTYPPEVLERLGAMLDLARTQAAGDEHALGWLRTAGLSYRHFADLARVYHLQRAYECNRTMENLKQVGAAVTEYRKLADEILAMNKTDPAFVKDYFPGWGTWSEVKGNGGMGGPNLATPFTWDFDTLINANVLPGKSRARAVVTKLDKAPKLDGTLDDPAWQSPPWQDMPEASMGKLEAKGRFKLAYDDKNLYVGFECEEPLCDQMTVANLSRDGAIWETECVELFFDPEASGAKYMHFILAPAPDDKYDGRAGYIEDIYHPLFSKEDPGWNPEYTFASKIDKANKKWTMTVAIPFATLGSEMPAEGTRWRGNFGRERNKAKWEGSKDKKEPAELSLWSPNLQKASFCDGTIFGDLYFGRIPEMK